MSHTFTLDGKSIPFEEGQTIIQAASKAGYLHPAPVLSPGIQATRVVQVVYGQGQWPADCFVHHACLSRYGR
jgi:hypothetical protein